jgi:hypothetical protein
MNAVMNLLNDKNDHLHKFLQLNENELINFAQGNFDNLEVFYQSRETILDLVRCIDGLVDVALKNEPTDTTAIAPEHKKELLNCLNRKNDLINQILAQDLQILSVIEVTKSEIIRDLRQVQAAKKAVGAYKSGDAPKTLNEEV